MSMPGDLLHTLPLYLVAILISLSVHEMMHALVGFKLGDDTAAERGRISLNPLRHIDPFMTLVLPVVTLLLFHIPFLAAKPVPFNPERVKYDEYGAAMIAAAGPFSNLAMAVLGALGLHYIVVGSVLTTFFYLFTLLNIALFVFNLIPIPPLDGSRVLYAFAPDPVRDLFDQAERYGFFILLILIVLPGSPFVTILSRIDNFLFTLLQRV